MRSEGHTAVKMSTVIFWIVMSCDLVGGYQRFEGIVVTVYKTTWRHSPDYYSRQVAQMNIRTRT
jgi:hypothetical protein